MYDSESLLFTSAVHAGCSHDGQGCNFFSAVDDFDHVLVRVAKPNTLTSSGCVECFDR